MRPLFQSKRPIVRSNRPATALKYGQFEPRCMLAGIQFLPATSQVLIGGTPQADAAVASSDGTTLTVTQSGFPTRTFQAQGVNSIIFVGLGGDDFFINNTNIFSFAFGGSGNDTLTGGFGGDRLFGQQGDDVVNGRAGNDFISGNFGNDRVIGGSGNDTLLGLAGTNFLLAGPGDDTVHGGVGRDIVRGGDGNDFLAGSSGDDEIFGEDGDDRIFGGAGRDFLRGGLDNDRIFGQNGDDRIEGGLGNDFLSGNTGNDLFAGEFDNDQIFGGEGFDRATYVGNIGDFTLGFNGPNATVNDDRGADGGVGSEGFDRLFAVEDLEFTDAVQRVGAPLVIVAPPVLPPVTPQNEVIVVQPIIVSNDDGSNTAEFFGSAEQQAEIIARIDGIYAVAGIDVTFLPARTLNDTFVNIGTDTDGGERAAEDLSTIVAQGDEDGVGSPLPNVIDMYFVELVPAFEDLGEGATNGLAFLGAPGIAIHIGDDLVATVGGRTAIAEVTAHEIGHNLGLEHTDIVGNLLTPIVDGDDLTPEQIAIARRSPLSQVA